MRECIGEAPTVSGAMREPMQDSLLRLAQVREACALSRSELYRLIRSGEFPRQIALGRRAVAWRKSEIQEWIAVRPQKSGQEGSLA